MLEVSYGLEIPVQSLVTPVYMSREKDLLDLF